MAYVALLYRKGLDEILKKIGEESAEVIIAAKDGEQEKIIYSLVRSLVFCVVFCRSLFVFRGVRAAQSLVFCVVFCLSLFGFRGVCAAQSLVFCVVFVVRSCLFLEGFVCSILSFLCSVLSVVVCF